ncbi:General odorant-binding protein 28a [Frankliniella fusca]|uniref:General odorant-binding protein 28a n=1 Tax=Frankliniella fusca TaxID=407009 RepID=A0AAE1HBA9_9NEOP|nr:General odorant-binding protein 28a [Frankliniella fusca]
MKVQLQLPLALAALAALACLAHAAEEEEAMKKEALEIRAKCLADLKGTEAELKEIEEKHEVTTDFAKKMTLCVFRAYKIIDDKNKFAKDSVVEAAKKAFAGKEDMLKAAQEIAEACDKEVAAVEGPAEETAKSVYDCLKKNVIERKLFDNWKI